jgi:hypothetical protein
MAANLSVETIIGRKSIGVEGEGGVAAEMCLETKKVTIKIESSCGNVLHASPDLAMKVMGAVSKLCSAGPEVVWCWKALFLHKFDYKPTVFRIRKITHPDGSQE